MEDKKSAPAKKKSPPSPGMGGPPGMPPGGMPPAMGPGVPPPMPGQGIDPYAAMLMGQLSQPPMGGPAAGPPPDMIQRALMSGTEPDSDDMGGGLQPGMAPDGISLQALLSLLSMLQGGQSAASVPSPPTGGSLAMGAGPQPPW